MIELMNESEDELIRKGCAYILVETLSTSRGQNVYFETQGVSPTKGFFTLNQMPRSILELLQVDSSFFEEIKKTRPKDGKKFMTLKVPKTKPIV